MPQLTLLELPDDPSARGLHHGKVFRGEIASVFRAQVDNILSAPSTAQRGATSLDDLLRFTRRYLDAARAFHPPLWAELEGIAEGSGLSTEEVLFLNLHLEMIDLANARFPYRASAEAAPGPEAGCTDIAIQRPDGRGCVVAQTYDLRSFYEPAAFAFRTRVGGMTVSGLSFAGVLAANGINSSGFAVVINKLYGTDSRVGVPHPFVVRAALEAETSGRALSQIVGTDRACSIHYLCADAAGLLFPVETTATEWELLDVGADGLYVHTNHFLSPRLHPQETRDFRLQGAHTLVRLQRARQLLRRVGPTADLAAYAELLDDTHNHPLAICSVDDGDNRFASVAKCLFDTGTGRAFFARGAGRLAEVPDAAWTSSTAALGRSA